MYVMNICIELAWLCCLIGSFWELIMAEVIGPRLYSCCNCRNQVSLHDDIISKAFQVWSYFFSLFHSRILFWAVSFLHLYIRFSLLSSIFPFLLFLFCFYCSFRLWHVTSLIFFYPSLVTPNVYMFPYWNFGLKSSSIYVTYNAVPHVKISIVFFRVSFY